MNFSNACRLKKGLSLILIVLMVVGMFSGCKKNNSETEPNTTPSLNLNMSDTSAPTQETVPPTTTEPIVYNENMGTVTNQISVRVIPSKDANVTGTLDAGTVVEILRQETIADITWGMISTPVSGWICMDYVKMYSSQNGSASSETDPNASQPTTPAPSDNTGNTTNNSGTHNTKGVISARSLNVRDEASASGKIVGSYFKGDVVTILETKDGWGRTDKGWISLSYVYMDGDVGPNAVYGTVTASELNVRSGPGTTYDRVKALSQNDRVQVLQQITVGGTTWGYVSGGWVSMDYVSLDGGNNTGNTNTGNTGNTGTSTGTGTGTVTGTAVNVRAGAGQSYQTVGSKTMGDVVTIYETVTAEGYTWGRIDTGWICMNYVRMN